MAVVGAIVEPERALLWVDAQRFHRRKRSADALKMGVTAKGLVTVGTGAMPLVREASAVAQACLTIDDVQRRMPGRLRTCAAKLAPDRVRRNPRWFSGQSVVAAGFSPSAGRMVGWRFDAESFFEPTLTSRVCVPSDAGLEDDLRGSAVPVNVLTIARRQVALLRRCGVADANGGALTLAEVTASSICCWHVPDLDIAEVERSTPTEAVPSPVIFATLNAEVSKKDGQ